MYFRKLQKKSKKNPQIFKFILRWCLIACVPGCHAIKSLVTLGQQQTGSKVNRFELLILQYMTLRLEWRHDALLIGKNIQDKTLNKLKLFRNNN